MDSEFREQLFQVMGVTEEPKTEVSRYDDNDLAFFECLRDWAKTPWRGQHCIASLPLTELGLRICQSQVTLPPTRTKKYLLHIIPLIQTNLRRVYNSNGIFTGANILLWHNRAFYLIATHALKEDK